MTFGQIVIFFFLHIVSICRIALLLSTAVSSVTGSVVTSKADLLAVRDERTGWSRCRRTIQVFTRTRAGMSRKSRERRRFTEKRIATAGPTTGLRRRATRASEVYEQIEIH